VANAARYESDLTHFEFGRRQGHFTQIKGWKDYRSYPLRNREQASRKIHQDRLPR